MFEERPSPIVASAASARKLPRMALLALLVVFIIPGLLSRDFWSSYELTSFALVHSMLQSDAVGWLLPQLGENAYVTNGPLSLWVSALLPKSLGRFFRSQRKPLKRSGLVCHCNFKHLVWDLVSCPSFRSSTRCSGLRWRSLAY